MPDSPKSRVGPLPVLAGLLVAAGGFGILGSRPNIAETPCDPALAACPSAEATARRGAGPPEPSVRESRAACRNVGYLCAELETRDRIHVRRWKDFSETLVVHVPRPDFEDGGDAARLQEAAARGLRAWNGQPFRILTDLRGSRAPHFSVRWTRALPGGGRIGVAHTEWSSRDGLSVVAIELATRNPYQPELINDARQVQLTAAHEMGHALGLQHSDSESDVMYPTNTATSLSARDYRTMEALYGLPDGTEIVR